jgi:hypothetical protein
LRQFFERMFIRIGMEDTLKIRCYQLDTGKFHEHLEDELHAKYSNKVIPNQGLVLLVRDYEQIGAPYIFPGQGNVNIKLKFGLIVFRPFPDEVIQGTIRFSDPTGILSNSRNFELLSLFLMFLVQFRLVSLKMFSSRKKSFPRQHICKVFLVFELFSEFWCFQQ